MSRPSQHSGPCWGQILLDVRDGQRDYADFFDAAYSDLYWFLRRCGLQHHDAEDLASEVMTKIYRQIATLNAASAAEATAWVYAIARNACNDYLRRTSRGKMQELDPGLDPPGPGNHQLSHENIEDIQRLLIRLDDDERELLERRFVDGLKLREIAEIKQTTVTVVANKIYRALSKLRKYAEEDNHD